MSYILEALKKSDRERKQGQVPDLQSLHGQRLSQGRWNRRGTLRLWGVGASVLVIVVGVAYWGMQRRNSALQEKLAVLEKSVGQLQAQPVQAKGQSPVPGPPVEAALPPAPPPVRPAQREGIPAAPVPAPPGEATTRKPTPALPPEATQLPVEEETVIRPENLPQKVEPQAIPVDMVPKTSTHAANPAEALPLLEDLPESVQKQLPPLKLAGHAYAREVERRMIMINNRICREGDMVADRLVLEEILVEGIVLRYQDIRFRINLL